MSAMVQRFQSCSAAIVAVVAIVFGAMLAAHGTARAQPASFAFTKTPSPTTYTAASQVITYTYVITNNQLFSAGHLDNLVDDKVASVSCVSSGGGSTSIP